MALSTAEMNLMGSTNNYWGVCGFTSSFYSMYELNPGKRALLVGAGIATKVLAEIKTYLMMLKAAANTQLLSEIETFTKSFGIVGKCNFGNFTIENYIRLINDAVNKSDAELRGNCNYSIAMPPDAVADYLRRIWDYESEVQAISGGGGGNEDGIIGVTNGTMKLYDGLCHYMYRANGKVYSWGKVFNSVTEANANYRVCLLIKIKQSGLAAAASSASSSTSASRPS
jgi:hypothetical protein